MLLDNVCPQKSCSFTALLWCHTMKSTRSREWRRCSLFLVLLAFSYPQLNKCAAVNQTHEWHATPAPTSRSSAVKNLFLRWHWHTPASPQAKAPPSLHRVHQGTGTRMPVLLSPALLNYSCGIVSNRSHARAACPSFIYVCKEPLLSPTVGRHPNQAEAPWSRSQGQRATTNPLSRGRCAGTKPRRGWEQAGAARGARLVPGAQQRCTKSGSRTSRGGRCQLSRQLDRWEIIETGDWWNYLMALPQRNLKDTTEKCMFWFLIFFLATQKFPTQATLLASWPVLHFSPSSLVLPNHHIATPASATTLQHKGRGRPFGRL